MTTNHTIQYLQADLHRGQNAGQTQLTINIKDLAEILNLAQRAESVTPEKRETHHVGYMHPEALVAILSGVKGSSRIHRSPRGGNTVEILFSGKVKEIVAEHRKRDKADPVPA